MKEIIHHDFNKPPLKGNMIFYPITWLLSLPSMKFHRLKVERINMDSVKRPYMLLSNHMSFYDLKLLQAVLFPHRANFVTAIDAFVLHNRFIRCQSAVQPKEI